jgi:hypothetical protein
MHSLQGFGAEAGGRWLEAEQQAAPANFAEAGAERRPRKKISLEAGAERRPRKIFLLEAGAERRPQEIFLPEALQNRGFKLQIAR